MSFGEESALNMLEWMEQTPIGKRVQYAIFIHIPWIFEFEFELQILELITASRVW